MSSRTELERLEELAIEVVEAHGLSLYDVQVGSERGRAVLRVFVDKPGPREPGQGVTINECALVSRELEQLLDGEDPIEGAYFLEVSSPGVERDLTVARHWHQAVGERVLLTLVNNPEGSRTLEGIVESVEGEVVRFRESPPRKKWKKGQRPKVVPVEKWALIEVSLLDVRKARTVYEFG